MLPAASSCRIAQIHPRQTLYHDHCSWLLQSFLSWFGEDQLIFSLLAVTLDTGHRSVVRYFGLWLAPVCRLGCRVFPPSLRWAALSASCVWTASQSCGSMIGSCSPT